MFKFWKKKSKSNANKDESEYIQNSGFENPVWYDVSEGNPFNSRVLDIRSVTLNIVATTKEKWIAKNFIESRSDIGEQYIDKEVEGGKRFQINMCFPHNGDELEGIVYKSESMDEKWDIYAYGEWFYFVRSWTSELVYKVHYSNTGSELKFDYLFTNDVDSPELHDQNLYSIFLTYVFGRVWPYVIPEHIRSESEVKIALYLFSKFGCKATIATYENVFDLQLVESK